MSAAAARTTGVCQPVTAAYSQPKEAAAMKGITSPSRQRRSKKTITADSTTKCMPEITSAW